MIVCKITLNNQPQIDYNSIIEKILNTGDFIITAAEKEFEIFFASEKEEIDEIYVRKALRRYKVDYMVLVYDLSEKLDLDIYSNQWVIANLDKQLKIKIEKEQQPMLKKIDKKLDLLNQVIEETNNAKKRYEEALLEIQKKEKEEDQNG